jgi:putative membrane protein
MAGMILTAISLKAIFKQYEVYAYAFFIGLIIASVVYVMGMIGKKTPKMIILMLVAIIVSFYLSIKSNPYPNDDFLYLILCGIIGSLGMIVPGISGSHLMMVMGNYELIVTHKNTHDEQSIAMIELMMKGRLYDLATLHTSRIYYVKEDFAPGNH